MGVNDVDAGPDQAEHARRHVQATRRNRELYKYLEPKNLQPHHHLMRRNSVFDFQDNAPNITSALAPFAQLAALRCNAQKAMINVMDIDIMYFLAEATTVQHDSSTGNAHSLVEDPIFLGCSGVPLSGRICELTIRLDKVETGHSYPIFTISDLSQDDRFKAMSIVQHEPFYRFYAGTPVVSRDGISIGSLAVMDTKPRARLTEDEERCLGETAEHIMTFFEINRQAIAGRRSRKLAQGLDCFVAGKQSLDEIQTPKSAVADVPTGTKSFYGVPMDSQKPVPQSPLSPTDSNSSPRKRLRARSRASLRSISSAESLRSSSKSSVDHQDDTRDDPVSSAARILGRASNLIRESLELPEDAGVLFLNVNDRLNIFGASTSPSASPERPSLPKRDQGSTGSIESLHDEKESIILASSTWERPIATGGADPTLKNVSSLTSDFLRELVKCHPTGRIWAFGDSGVKLSSSDDEQSFPSARNISLKQPKIRPGKKKASDIIQQAFPGARSVLFYPLLDVPSSLHPIAAFVFSCSETQPLTTPALTFLNSFCNTAKAEAARADAVRSDRQKTDFVSTISHETRSPLHGVLASVEFLMESDLNGFQKSLVDTIDACGRTLLDTINHVLDYSKIASFETDWHATKYGSSRSRKRNTVVSKFAHRAPQLLRLTAATDVSVILEEIVDGIAIGQTYNSSLDITDISRESRGTRSAQERTASNKGGIAKIEPERPFVEIILDIQQADWVFQTTPGSLRRVFMNIFGNAVKYTPATGSIRVQLQFKESDDGALGAGVLLLTVTDTGVGISLQFLSSKIYTPFAQENPLSPGTGLGLSIVRSIVTMLGGTVSIRSKVGEGTNVQVALPMTRPLSGASSPPVTPLAGSTTCNDSIQFIKDYASSCRVAVVGFEKGGQSGGTPVLPYVLASYVQNWFQLEVLGPADYDRASLIIVEDKDLDDVMRRSFGTSGRRPSLIVICSVTSRHKQTIYQEYEPKTESLVVIAKPCGPYKLAKALKICLETANRLRSHTLEAISEQPTPYSPAMYSSSDRVADQLHELELRSPGNRESSTMVQADEGVAFSQASQNAQMAIHDPSITSGSLDQSVEAESFPFPAQEESIQPLKPADESPVRSVKDLTINTVTTDILTPVPTIVTPSKQQIEASHPRVLLVDDNKINLKLLQTFVKKRGYTQIDSAEDGLQALDAVKSAPVPYDIIFMDLSMPVMDGFEATESIRRFEAQAKMGTGAMIIALTGLASARDQAEAFTVGCDIYLMKPVKFKEVGKLLDNWEAHQRMRGAGSGSMSSEDAMRVSMAVGGALTADGFMGD